MSLSCECYDDSEWFYTAPDYYTTFSKNRRKRCCSCIELIDIGSICTEFECYRTPRNEIEERIHGDEVYTANKFLCESCSDIYYSLCELGFCVILGDMLEQLNEYQEYKRTSIIGD
jgi:hypothetical protein